jgi:hypothetical protein
VHGGPFLVGKARGLAGGSRSHGSPLRAAFGVQFDEEDQFIALKELMGHARIETTLVYLRRKDKARAMETVRSLSWGRFVFPPSEEAAYRKAPKYRCFLEEAHTGFEPVPPACRVGASV